MMEDYCNFTKVKCLQGAIWSWAKIDKEILEGVWKQTIKAGSELGCSTELENMSRETHSRYCREPRGCGASLASVLF